MDTSDQDLENSKPEPESSSKEPEIIVDSITLNRLLDEVRNGKLIAPGAYNRVHNRHNR